MTTPGRFSPRAWHEAERKAAMGEVRSVYEKRKQALLALERLQAERPLRPPGKVSKEMTRP